MKREAGYALLEVLLLSLFVLTMVAMLALFSQTTVLQQKNGRQAQVIYLVQEEFAHLEQRGAQKNLRAGTYDWLGDTEAIDMARGTCQIRAEVGTAEDGVYPVTVTAHWQSGRKEQKMTVQRQIVIHGGKDEQKST